MRAFMARFGVHMCRAYGCIGTHLPRFFNGLNGSWTEMGTSCKAAVISTSDQAEGAGSDKIMSNVGFVDLNV